METRALPIEAAKQLIEFIFSTNYLIAPCGDGHFDKKDEALAYVDSGKYESAQSLYICFDTKQGDYYESAEVTFDGSEWIIEDHSMGGHLASGASIQDAIEKFRLKHDLNCKYCPVELVVNQ